MNEPTLAWWKMRDHTEDRQSDQPPPSQTSLSPANLAADIADVGEGQVRQQSSAQIASRPNRELNQELVSYNTKLCVDCFAEKLADSESWWR